jgi:hypothetical protein
MFFYIYGASLYQEKAPVQFTGMDLNEDNYECLNPSTKKTCFHLNIYPKLHWVTSGEGK